jgi:hypothetical protein
MPEEPLQKSPWGGSRENRPEGLILWRYCGWVKAIQPDWVVKKVLGKP